MYRFRHRDSTLSEYCNPDQLFSEGWYGRLVGAQTGGYNTAVAHQQEDIIYVRQ